MTQPFGEQSLALKVPQFIDGVTNLQGNLLTKRPEDCTHDNTHPFDFHQIWGVYICSECGTHMPA